MSIKHRENRSPSILLICFVMLLLVWLWPLQASALQLELDQKGTWTTSRPNLIVGEHDLIGGAGGDFQGTHESAADFVTIDVTGGVGQAWQVDAKRDNDHWHEDLVLSVRRTDQEFNTDYVVLGVQDVEVFSGEGNEEGIKLQYKVSGVSVTLGAATFTTTIIYTVREEE